MKNSENRNSLEKSRIPKIIAPLNDWKSLTPELGVLDNCDEVYFGLKSGFSMRARAGNFDIRDLKKLMETIHSRENSRNRNDDTQSDTINKPLSKKGNLSTNIIIYNDELDSLAQILSKAADAGVDAVIAHDPAAILLCKEMDIPFHVSTQANISNWKSAEFYEKFGAERVILAREVNLKEIAEINQKIKIPIEAFVHGAMCTAISGRCYLSAELMGFNREFSANRGKCVQPCRRMYKFLGEENEILEYSNISYIEEFNGKEEFNEKEESNEKKGSNGTLDKYITDKHPIGMFFNAKDLCMIEYIPELVGAGVEYFKIEGRMRDPLYISETTRIYRKAINIFLNEPNYYKLSYMKNEGNNYIFKKNPRIQELKNELKNVFNRDFHTGFYFNIPTPNEIQFSKRGNASPVKKILIGIVKNSYKKAGAVEIELSSGEIKLGDTLIFENRADFFHKQLVKSIQLDGKNVEKTPPGSSKNHIIAGILVSKFVPKNALVFKLSM